MQNKSKQRKGEKFYKYHGAGNDFIMIDNMNGKISLSKEQVILLCDRHYGIGADGLILVESSDKADCFMNYYDSDGSIKPCGNGTRCTAKFLKDKILRSKNNFSIDTREGTKYAEYRDDNTFSVNMGKPVFSHPDFPKQSLELEGVSVNCVSMGNPHAVAFVPDLDTYDILTLGPKIENNKNFPNKINFELVEERSKNEFKVQVWERGGWATLACGTGACSVYAIARKCKNADKEVTLHLPGGDLFLSENKKEEIILRGPAVCVFEGKIAY